MHWSSRVREGDIVIYRLRTVHTDSYFLSLVETFGFAEYVFDHYSNGDINFEDSKCKKKKEAFNHEGDGQRTLPSQSQQDRHQAIAHLDGNSLELETDGSVDSDISQMSGASDVNIESTFVRIKRIAETLLPTILLKGVEERNEDSLPSWRITNLSGGVEGLGQTESVSIRRQKGTG
jgi:hypothetical protein